MDADGDGELTAEEIFKFCSPKVELDQKLLNLGNIQQLMDQMIAGWDEDGDSSISKEEWLAKSKTMFDHAVATCIKDLRKQEDGAATQ